MTRDFFISIMLQMPCPSIGSKLFWTGPPILDRFQNVKFSSKKLFLVWSKTFWTCLKLFWTRTRHMLLVTFLQETALCIEMGTISAKLFREDSSIYRSHPTLALAILIPIQKNYNFYLFDLGTKKKGVVC